MTGRFDTRMAGRGRIWFPVLICAAGLGGCAPAATPAKRLVACANPVLGVDRAIDACTSLIVVHQGQPAKLAEVLAYRGMAYTVRNERERGSRDYDEAVRLDPTNPEILWSRGTHHSVEKRDDLALRDFDEAVRLTPGTVNFLRRRGNSTTGGGVSIRPCGITTRLYSGTRRMPSVGTTVRASTPSGAGPTWRLRITTRRSGSIRPRPGRTCSIRAAAKHTSNWGGRTGPPLISTKAGS